MKVNILVAYIILIIISVTTSILGIYIGKQIDERKTFTFDGIRQYCTKLGGTNGFGKQSYLNVDDFLLTCNIEIKK